MKKADINHILQFGPDIDYSIAMVRTYVIKPNTIRDFSIANKHYEALNMQSDQFTATVLTSNIDVLFGRAVVDLWESYRGYLQTSIRQGLTLFANS